jgi:uncharacterized repeat protein (TIGR01451 family)
MKVNKLLLSVAIASVVGVASLSATAMAWHPKGVITKKVQNVTTGSALSEADSSAQAVAAKSGDTLKYTIEVKNVGAADSHGYNDMVKTVMKDTLPAGVELASDPSQRQITADLGTITPGKSIVKEYLVKVTTKTAGAIQNTACFTGNSKANDNAQQGCNSAFVKVTVPEIPVTPTTPVTPETPAPQPEMPVELPHTGMAENIVLSALVIGAVTYVAQRYVASRRAIQATLLDL